MSDDLYSTTTPTETEAKVRFPRNDLTGRRFTRLVVLQFARRNLRGDVYWECLCDCGKIRTVYARHLLQGRTRSCGCWSKDGLLHLRHGHNRVQKRTPTYTCWAAMIGRCYNPNNQDFPRYGGRGITVCAEWHTSFEAFLRDMGEKPIGMSIERKDNEKGYFFANCKWATATEQANNRHTNTFLTFNNETHNLSGWAKIKGFSADCLKQRIRLGWSIEKALTTPVRHQKRRKG